MRNLSRWRLDEPCDFLIPLVAGVPCGKRGKMSDFNIYMVMSVVRSRMMTFSALEWELVLTAAC